MAEWNEVESSVMEKLNKITTANEELVKKVNGQEDLIQGWKTEIGDARQEVKAALEAVKGNNSAENTEKLQTALDKIKEIEDNINTGKVKAINQGGNGGDQDLRKNMTADQKAVADEKFKALSEEERVKVKNDPEEMKLFLEAAMEVAPSVPDSLFDDEETQEPTVNKYRKVFGLTEQESNHIPGTGKSGAKTGYAGLKKKGDEGEPQLTRILPGGVMPTAPAP